MMSSSGDEGEVAAFPRYEYESIEKAVMESARGRWFLQEFAKRNRAADTLTLLEAIGRLQTALGARPAGPAPPVSEIASLAATIRATRSEIATARNDQLPDGGAVSDGAAIYAKIAEHAKTTASEIMAGAQELYQLLSELKAANNNDAQATRLAESARSFQALSWSQDLLSQRIAKAMGLLSQIDDRINALAGMANPPQIEPHHLKYFAGDEGLFEPAATPASTPQSAEDGKQRIMIIRKPSGEPVDIPFADELPERVA